MIEITQAAGEVLEKAYDAASSVMPEAKIRVFRRKEQVETGFADAPQAGDVTVEYQGMILYVAENVGEGVLDVSERHDHLILKPVE